MQIDQIDSRTGIALSLLGDQLKLAILSTLDVSRVVEVSVLRKRTALTLWRFSGFGSVRGFSNKLKELEEEKWIMVSLNPINNRKYVGLLPPGEAVLKAVMAFQNTLLANHIIREHGPIDEDTRTGAMVRMCLTCGAVSFGNKGANESPTEWGPWELQKLGRLAPDCYGH